METVSTLYSVLDNILNVAVEQYFNSRSMLKISYCIFVLFYFFSDNTAAVQNIISCSN